MLSLRDFLMNYDHRIEAKEIEDICDLEIDDDGFVVCHKSIDI